MYGNKVKDWTILSQAPFQGEGATTIENTSNDGSEQSSSESEVLSTLKRVMIQSKLYRNIKIICGNDILVNNNVMYLVWMYIMRWMNNGYGDQGGDPAVQRQLQTLQDQMQDNHNSDLIMQAIKGNSSALQDLTTRLSCDAIQSAIQSVQSSIANVGSQVGFSSERIINAVNSGDSGIIQALNNCCCSTQKEILKMGYENQINNQNQTYQLTSQLNGVNNVIQNGFRDTNYVTQQQTCSLQNTIKDTTTINTNAILAKLDALSTSALQDKIEALRERNSEQAAAINNSQQSALFAQMLQQLLLMPL